MVGHEANGAPGPGQARNLTLYPEANGGPLEMLSKTVE